MEEPDYLGKENVKKLMFRLGWPAVINFAVQSVYNLTDVVFAGRWLGSMQIAAIVTVGSVIMLFSSIGLIVGTGGASIISRAMGEKNKVRAANVFGNQLILITVCCLSVVAVGFLFEKFILKSFGAYGDIFPFARIYYRILLMGVPFLTFSMMANMVIQAVGRARVALVNSLVPTLVNGILNPVLIKGLHMGIAGSAWATCIAFGVGCFMVARFFFTGGFELKKEWNWRRYNPQLCGEIIKIGSSVVVGVIASNGFVVLLNKILYRYQQESGIIIYSIINRVGMIFLVSIVGIDGGVRPIIGYNFGSRQIDRVREAVLNGIKYGMSICVLLLAVLLLFSEQVIQVITNDPKVIGVTPHSMRIVFAMSPLYIFDVVSMAYFQSIGKPGLALFVTMLRNVFLLIPMIYILSWCFGYEGVLYSFPVVDILTTIPVFWVLRREINRTWVKATA